MDNRSEVREFLTTRRARLNPGQVGLPPARSRRVPGLRRSEVAAVAGLSVEYYAWARRRAATKARIAWAATTVAAHLQTRHPPDSPGAAPDLKSATPKEPDADHPQLHRHCQRTR